MILDLELPKPTFHPNRIVLSLDGDITYCMNVLQDILNEQDTIGKQLLWGVKLNSNLIHDGVHIVKMLKDKGVKIMADPKLYDISTTMADTITILNNVKSDIITVHASSGFYTNQINIMSRLACVTVLTSFTEDACKFIYNDTLENTILKFAKWAYSVGYGFLVCAPTDLELLRDIPIKKICPGVRPHWYGTEDNQVRTMGPYQTRLEGADLIVVGRPIMNAKVPVDAMLRLNEDMGYI